MGMVVSFIAFRVRRVNGDVGNHAFVDKLLLNEVQEQRLALRLVEFMGQAQLDFAGKLRVLAAFDSFHSVPELSAVVHPVG